MKKVRNILLLIYLLGITTCSKDENYQLNDFKQRNILQPNLASNAGVLHNFGCSHLISTVDTYANPIETNQLLGRILNYYVSQNELRLEDSAFMSNLLAEDLQIIFSSDSIETHLFNLFYSLREDEFWDRNIYEIERLLIDSACSFFKSEISGFGWEQQCNLAIQKAEFLLDKWNQIDWAVLSSNKPESQIMNTSIDPGNLSRGFLEIMKHSAELWKEHRPLNPNNYPALTLIQLDALGYLWGWSKAVLEDYRNGVLIKERANKRIEAGITFAVEVSFFTWLTKYLK